MDRDRGRRSAGRASAPVSYPGIAHGEDPAGTPRRLLDVDSETDHAPATSCDLQGDFVFCHASSAELPRYGVKHGLTNWTAAYATGLLCARRALKKLGLDEKYEGITEPDGEMTVTEACESRSRRLRSCPIGMAS